MAFLIGSTVVGMTANQIIAGTLIAGVGIAGLGLVVVFACLLAAPALLRGLEERGFFRRFQLNVLEFSDATDFLRVVVREPLTVAMASLGLFFYWGYMWLTLRAAELLGVSRPTLARSPLTTTCSHVRSSRYSISRAFR